MTAVSFPRSNASQGILLVSFGIVLFSLQDVIVKQISGGYPVHQIVFLRSVIALVLLLAMMWQRGTLSTLQTNKLNHHALRGMLLVASYISYYLAIAALPLAEAVAIYFVSPIFVALLSILILKEQAKRAHAIALILGFSGTLIMMRPGVGVFEPAALFAIGAALTYALSVVMTKRMASTESGMTMSVYSTLAYLISTGIAGVFIGRGVATDSTHPSIEFLTRPWAMPSTFDLTLIVVTGAIAAVGFFCLAEAYRVADATTVAPFEYVMLPLSIVWGFLFWGEVPDAFVLIGVLSIIGGGMTLLPARSQQRRGFLLRR